MTSKEKTSNDIGGTTHFGYETVATEDKAERIAEVFDTVSVKYDVMNDIISLGTHRILKQHAVSTSNIRRGFKVLDLAGGTGDMTRLLSKRVGPTGRVVISDINAQMLEEGRTRLINEGIVGNVEYVLANAEHLPFEDDVFDVVTIGYGIRNFTNKLQSLREIRRVLKHGGRLTILDFSTPTTKAGRFLADSYSSLWPTFGKILVGSGEPYRYLVESIKMHPDQQAFKSLMEEAGLERVRYQNLLGGIAALHTGFKI